MSKSELNLKAALMKVVYDNIKSIIENDKFTNKEKADKIFNYSTFKLLSLDNKNAVLKKLKKHYDDESLKTMFEDKKVAALLKEAENDEFIKLVNYLYQQINKKTL